MNLVLHLCRLINGQLPLDKILDAYIIYLFKQGLETDGHDLSKHTEIFPDILVGNDCSRQLSYFLQQRCLMLFFHERCKFIYTYKIT